MTFINHIWRPGHKKSMSFVHNIIWRQKCHVKSTASDGDQDIKDQCHCWLHHIETKAQRVNTFCQFLHMEIRAQRVNAICQFHYLENRAQRVNAICQFHYMEYRAQRVNAIVNSTIWRTGHKGLIPFVNSIIWRSRHKLNHTNTKTQRVNLMSRTSDGDQDTKG